MYQNNRIRFVIFVCVMLLTVILLPGSYAQSNTDMISLDAGSWTPFLIESVENYRLDAPSMDDTDEIEMLKSMMAEVDDDMRYQIQYWTVGAPGYRWNEFAKDQMFFGGVPVPPASLIMALLNVAIYDGTIAAWDTKYAVNRPRPSVVDDSITPFVDVPNSPAYPSEEAVAAGAGSKILAYLFAPRADYYHAQGESAVIALKHSGIYYPSDVDVGFQLGKDIADEVITWIEESVFDTSPMEESMDGDGKWNSPNPILPNLGNSTPISIPSAAAFRPPPPPEFGSDQLESEMQELRDMERTPARVIQARYWEYGAGGPNAYHHWMNLFNQLVFEYNMHENSPMTALANAAYTVAFYDAVLAAWDGKYHYMAIRPFQYDPEFVAVFPAPNHPSYPAAHSVLTSAVVNTLATFFPQDAEDLLTLGNTVSDSRRWGGIHFLSDTVAGNEMGAQISAHVLMPYADILP